MRRIALLFVVLAAVIAVAAPAMAQPDEVNTNNPRDWELVTGLECYKVDGGFDDSGTWTSDGYYDLVVVKGGPVFVVYEGVMPGDVLEAPLNPKNKNGKLYGISHIIFCNGDEDPSG